jgi:S-adenosylmethionine:tRNA ribosyltransferase-isomerase
MTMNSADLKLASYHYDLPEELIAQRPANVSRLLVYKQQTNEIFHDTFDNIGLYLPKQSLLVFNQSKVFPSRLIGTKESGGKAEIFLLSIVADHNGYPALIRTTSKKKCGSTFMLPGNGRATIVSINSDGTFGVELKFEDQDLKSYLYEHAKIPIPPYIRNGESDEADRLAYQTVYAKSEGSVAAPTAGLHFKKELLQKLKDQKIDSAFVTLHVGLGTFKPVKTENILDHKMHSENFFFDEENDLLIKKARAEKRKVFAVGTTALRVLESSYILDLAPNEMQSTSIFLHPGIEVQSVDGLITNFHLPESTLLMLVSTLIGREKTLELYDIAIKERYRFFSYGDGMLIIR